MNATDFKTHFTETAHLLLTQSERRLGSFFGNSHLAPLMNNGIHPLLVERFHKGELFDIDRIYIDWSWRLDQLYGFEVFSYDFTDQQLELLRNWLIDFVNPEPGYFGSFVFDGKDAWGYSDPHDEEDYETWLDYE